MLPPTGFSITLAAVPASDERVRACLRPRRDSSTPTTRVPSAEAQARGFDNCPGQRPLATSRAWDRERFHGAKDGVVYTPDRTVNVPQTELPGNSVTRAVARLEAPAASVRADFDLRPISRPPMLFSFLDRNFSSDAGSPKPNADRARPFYRKGARTLLAFAHDTPAASSAEGFKELPP